MKSIYFAFLFFSSFSVLAQQNLGDLTTRKYEIGLNVTSVLSNLLVNETNQDQTEYPFSLKINGKKRTFRLGLTANVDKGDNFQFDNTNILAAARIGFEKRHLIGDRWIFLYGIDVHGEYSQVKSAQSTNFEVITLNNISTGIGLSPLIGFQFIINERVSLEVETNFLFFGYRETSDLTHLFNPSLNIFDEGYRYSFKMTEPRFLYLIVKI